MTAKPTPTLAVGKTGDGRVWGSDSFGSAAGVRSERDAGRWQFFAAGVTGEGRPKDPETQPADTLTGKGTAYWSLQSPQSVAGGPRAMRTEDEPSVTVTGNFDRAKWVEEPMPDADPADVVYVNGTQQNAARRPADQPAPTVMFGHRGNDVRWHLAQPLPDGQERVNDQSGTVVDLGWVDERPATTVATRDLVQHPGATANRTNGSTKSRNDGIRVTVAEAAILQSFPADHPWQGSKTKQYQQVGNAIPPRLALHVLAEATGMALPQLVEVAA